MLYVCLHLWPSTRACCTSHLHAAGGAYMASSDAPALPAGGQGPEGAGLPGHPGQRPHGRQQRGLHQLLCESASACHARHCLERGTAAQVCSDVGLHRLLSECLACLLAALMWQHYIRYVLWWGCVTPAPCLLRAERTAGAVRQRTTLESWVAGVPPALLCTSMPQAMFTGTLSEPCLLWHCLQHI